MCSLCIALVLAAHAEMGTSHSESTKCLAFATCVRIHLIRRPSCWASCRLANMLRRTFQSSAAAVVGRYKAVPPLVRATEDVLEILRKHRATTRLSQLGREVRPHELDTSYSVFVEFMSPDSVSKGFRFPALPPQKSNLMPDLQFCQERRIQDLKRAKNFALKK